MANIREVSLLLEPWFGANAEVLDYTTSLSILRIKLSKPVSPQCVVLSLRGCKTIQFIPAWGLFRPTMEELTQGDEACIRVRDGESLIVECSNIYVSPVLESWQQIQRSPLEG
jgi:hypothetical protein